jgi:imidazolonepropionase-like amidohydrolase
MPEYESEASMYRLFPVLGWAVLAVGALASTAAAQVAEEHRVALTNVTLIDGTGAAAEPGITVLISGGRIEAVFRTGAEALPPDADIIDLTDHFVIPGLINTHFHLPMLGRMRDSIVPGLERMFFSGVTSLREMAGDTRISGEIDRAGLLGESPIPSIYYAARMAGPTFYARGGAAMTSLGYEPGTAPWAQAVTNDTDMQRAVAMAVGTGATGLKLYADLDTGLVRTLIHEAHEQGLKAWAHGTIFPTGPLDAVRLGIDGLSHVCFIFWGLQDRVPPTMSERRPFDPAGVDLSADPYQTLFREMVKRGVVLDATARNASLNPGAAAAGCGPELLRETLLVAHRAGVRISTGTDYSIPSGEPDPTLFAEIEYLVDNGILSPLEAITAATLNGASAIGIEQNYGTVQPGKIADLVILASDPSADIAALQDVRAVIKTGKIHERQEYLRRESRR